MKWIKFFYISAVFVCFLAGKDVNADHYYGRYDERSHRQYKSYYHEYQGNEAYTQRHSYGYAARGHTEYHGPVSEGYYSCPRGDYISDRPGRCPLDGSILIPRGASREAKPVYTESYDRYY